MAGYEPVFEELRSMFKRNTSGYTVLSDDPGKYYVAFSSSTSLKPIWFGGVEITKSYVSFHLMPLYCSPSLTGKLSPQLKARMQGKSCLNFKVVDTELFAELEQILIMGREAFEKMDFGALKRSRACS